MLYVRDIMTRNVITATSDTPIHEAKKIMDDHHLRRLPVVDDGKLVGVVTRERLERVEHPVSTPTVWQLRYLLSHTTLRDVMRKDLVTVPPETTAEEGIALAQARQVGALLVVEDGKLVGICTTNDFFYRVLNPIFGIGEPGVRLNISEAGEDKALEDVVACVHHHGVRIRTLFTIALPEKKYNELVIHVDTEDASHIIEELRTKGYSVEVRAR